VRERLFTEFTNLLSFSIQPLFYMKSFSKPILAAALGLLPLAAPAAIIELNGDITADTRWTRDNVYVLTGITYVLPPAKLTIEPGTLIRGANDAQTSGSNNPGSVIICRGAKIVGSGTVDDPIIFTSVDDPNVPGAARTVPTTVAGNTYTALNYSVNGPTGNNAFAHSRQAGGLVILGRAPIAYDGNGNTARPSYNVATNTFSGQNLVLPTGAASPEESPGVQLSQGNGSGFAIIEGTPATVAVTLSAAFDADQAVGFDPPEVSTWAGPEEPISGTVGTIAASTSFVRGVYGGVNENDDSGVIRFWSLRYGGFPVTNDSEINGLTFGAAGRGTVTEWVDVINNADDAFEFFGGFNDCKYLFGMHCGDDYIDWDQGYSGTLQHVFIHSGGGEFFGRTGFTTNDTAPLTAGKSTSFNASERGFELDGPEPNNSGMLPRSNGWVFNVTMIGAFNGVSAGSNEDGIRARRATAGRIQAAIFENFPTASGIFETSDNGTSTTAGDPSRNALALVNPYTFSIGTAPPATIANTDCTTTGHVATTVAQLVAKGQLARFGLNPTLTDEAPSGTTVPTRKLTHTLPARTGSQNFLSPVRYAGAMRDNNMLFGWTGAHAIQLVDDVNLARPVLTLTVNGSNQPEVSFNADTTAVSSGDAVLYVVERSSDGGATFAPFLAVQDGDTSDLDTTAGTIRVADTASTVSSTALHYRVIPQ
jgi:hypothetical protein